MNLEVELKNFIMGIVVGNSEMVSKAGTALLKMPYGNDFIIIALREAIAYGYLQARDETAATIGSILPKSKKRKMLSSIAKGLSDPKVDKNIDWIDGIIFEDANISVEERQEFWNRISRVKEVQCLFEKLSSTTDRYYEPAESMSVCSGNRFNEDLDA